MRIQAFDYFRAIAILFIVASHSYGTNFHMQNNREHQKYLEPYH